MLPTLILVTLLSQESTVDLPPRMPGVEAAAHVILKRPDLQRVLLSALLCAAEDRALEELITDPTGLGPAALDVIETKAAFVRLGIPPLPCVNPEISYIVLCLGESPPLVCHYAYRIDAFVRAAELLGRRFRE